MPTVLFNFIDSSDNDCRQGAYHRPDGCRSFGSCGNICILKNVEGNTM